LVFLSLLVGVAIDAIEAKNHTELIGKVIRVTWSHRDPDARRSGKGNVFVKVSVFLFLFLTDKMIETDYDTSCFSDLDLC
jgi:hypothetical protein